MAGNYEQNLRERSDYGRYSGLFGPQANWIPPSGRLGVDCEPPDLPELLIELCFSIGDDLMNLGQRS
jgi:hypothetical protein